MKVLLCLVLCGMAVLAIGQKVKYDNYKVMRFNPRTQEEHDFLLDLEENNPGVVFWKHVRGIGYNTDIMFPPHLQHMLEGISTKGVAFYEMVNDVQSLIDVEALGTQQGPSPKLTWDAYYSTEEIHEFLDEMGAKHAAATVGVYGQSFQGRDMKYIKINKGNTKKPVVWIDANIHAREWITNTIATYIVNELLEGTPESQAWLDVYNFYIIPVMNPDGYEYTRSNDRLWRKTRSNLAGGICMGADPNRNFDFSWNTGGSSNQPCSDTFMGIAKSSEPEVAATEAFIDEIAAEDDLVFYLSLHSYSQLILIPFGTALGRVPDHDFHMTVGNAAAAAIRRRYNTNFTPGNIVELLYVASGSSGDHVKGVYETPLSFTFEMRDTGSNGFILPPAQIIPSCLEFLDGFHVILDALKTKIAK